LSTLYVLCFVRVLDECEQVGECILCQRASLPELERYPKVTKWCSASFWAHCFRLGLLQGTAAQL